MSYLGLLKVIGIMDSQEIAAAVDLPVIDAVARLPWCFRWITLNYLK